MYRYILLAIGLVFSLIPAPNAHADIHSVIVQGDGINTRIIISADSEIVHDEFLTIGSGSSLVVDVEDKAWIGDEGTFQPVGGILAREWVDGQLVFWLEQPMQISRALDLPPYGGRTSHRLIIDLMPISRARFEKVAKKDMKRLESLASQRRLALAEGPRRVAAGGERYVVVIDPGHGGRDPGANHHGAVERAIVLDSAKQLKALLDRNPMYDARLTRDGDTYVEHEDRVSLARDWDADLFISLHADAAGTPEVKGASVYTLSSKGEKRVDGIAEENNWELPIETGETTEEAADILEVFLKRETKSNSERFAGLLIPELSKGGPVLRNTHREGNYFVLLAPDVPAVLVELGFLTNKDDAKRLNSTTGQRKSMAAIARAIDAYFEQQDVLLAKN